MNPFKNYDRFTSPKYGEDLKSGLVRIKEAGLGMVQISNGICNQEAQPFEIQTNGCHFVKKHLKSGQKCPDFDWSGFQMVGSLGLHIAIAIAKF